MRIKHLTLEHFRNYARLDIDIPARITLLQGQNAQGKTNLLEAIYYLSATKSPRASSDRQLLDWNTDDVIPFARVEGVFDKNGAENTVEITIVLEPRNRDGLPQTVVKRRLRLNGVPRRAMDLVGHVNEVLFLPEDLTLVSGAPGMRRRYLDVMLCQIDRVYCQSLSRYSRVVVQRNSLLRQIRERRSKPGELDYWDDQAARLGALVMARRLWAIDQLNTRVATIHPALTDGGEHIDLDYVHGLSSLPPCHTATDSCSLDANEALIDDLAGMLRQGLLKARREELGRAVTTVGPHRDDVRFLLNGVDATTYGSRGQQRTVALSLKLAEVDLMHHCTGEMPILLLDDVISELDRKRCELLLRMISEAGQVLVTTTDLDYFAADFLSSVCRWDVSGGAIHTA